jgi:hypothetical protein
VAVKLFLSLRILSLIKAIRFYYAFVDSHQNSQSFFVSVLSISKACDDNETSQNWIER